MAWRLHFDGRQIAAIDDTSHERIKEQLTVAAQTEAIAWIDVYLSNAKFELLWTPGAAIYFEEFDESAQDRPDQQSTGVIRRVR